MKYKYISAFLLVVFFVFGFVSYKAIKTTPTSLNFLLQNQKKNYYFDKYGEPLNVTYANTYNNSDLSKLHEVPSFFTMALLYSEDKNFYEHSGVDWFARFSALAQNIKALKKVRGASTISEQVVRIITPRKRSVFSKWIEGFEASNMEDKFSKVEILEFYINQVPYASQRRGVKQAAKFYFNRDIETLNEKEMLGLVILIRSPRYYSPFNNKRRLDKKIEDLADKLFKDKKITKILRDEIYASKLVVAKEKAIVNASHFINYVDTKIKNKQTNKIHTTLDGYYQHEIQNILDAQLKKLKIKNVNNGAVLVLNHHTNEVISWVVGFAGKKDKSFNSYDPIRVLRQPGSTLKPFLYARAFEKGYEASTLIDDSELREGVGLGSHTYRNYSNHHYGKISVRESLANSLNIPAVKTLQFIGTQDFLEFLNRFGILSLDKHPNFYGDGLALGNSEVTLLELTRAYSTLARMGSYKELSVLENEYALHVEKNIIDEKITSLLADILSDPLARSKEFGFNSILNLPNQTAVKTGTSSDYRDAWVFGYDDKYTVGVWFGNLNYESMKKVTGSSGPAVVLKTTFALLNKHRQTHALYLSKDLIKIRDENFNDEYYLNPLHVEPKKIVEKFKIIQPSKNLIMAKDPRIPDNLESYIFKVSEDKSLKNYVWYINDKKIATTDKPEYEWFIKRGDFVLEINGAKVKFSVK